jgi:COP9 signalosome complex subunit 3
LFFILKMDGVVTLILKSTKEDDIKELPKRLEKAAKGLKKGVQIPLHLVHPENNTYGYLFLLFLKVTGTDIKDHGEFVEQAKALMIFGDGYQIRMGGKLFAKVCGQFRLSIVYADQALRGIIPLTRAVEKLRGTNQNMLTSVHADLMYVCLKAHHYRAAIPVLDVPVFSIDPKATGIEPQQYLEYFYFAGTVCIGLKRFSQAVDLFQMGLTCPSQVLSAVQIEIYKKYVLVCLLAFGEFKELPSTTSGVVAKHAERLCHPYKDFAQAFKLGMDQVQRVVADNHKAFTADKNYGLVRQTVQALVRRKIQRLTSTYVTLSLSDIAVQANLSSPADAEAHVASMIEDGAIFAKINQKDGMLSFLDDPEDYNTVEMVETLDAKLKAVMRLSDKLHAANRDILLDQRFIANQMQELMGSGGKGPDMHGHRGGMGDNDEDFQLSLALSQSMAQH